MSDKDQQNNQSLPNKENDSPQPQGAAAPTSSTTNEIRIPGRAPPQLAVPGIAASPPQFVTMNEIMSTANGLMNMQLLHEIVLDKDFKLTPFQPLDNSIQKVVKETIHRAFWDLLAEELHSDPPIYSRAMGLLEEVKTMLLDLLHPVPQHEKLRQEINEMIDIPFIEQQAKNEALDFLGYAQFIINLMSRLCAPARDEKIEELKQMSDPVQIYKGVLETLTLMRMDLANFEIEMFRSELTAQSVEYEKNKFAQALALQGGIGSLIYTRKWLQRHVQDSSNSSDREIMLSAYLELFEWNLPEEFPETAAMDFKRITELGLRLKQLITAGTVLLVTLSRASWPPLQQSVAFKEKLLRDVCTLLEDVKTDEALKNILPNVAVQVINIVRKQVDQEKNSGQELPAIEVNDAFQQSLSELIEDIHRIDHSVRRVVKQRTNEFLRISLSSAANIPKQLPPGMTSLRSELLSATGSIIRLYKYNLAVFGDYYSQIVTKVKEEGASVS